MKEEEAKENEEVMVGEKHNIIQWNMIINTNETN